MKKRTTQEFLIDAKKIHGERYDYSETEYSGRHSKLSIGCKIHGPFPQIAGDHLNGAGCPKCADILIGEKIADTPQEVLAKFFLVHNGRYEYPNLISTRDRNKIEIICSIHGPFWQTIGSHKNGRGCPVCGDLSTADSLRKTPSENLEDILGIHGSRYSYPDCENYRNVNKEIEIICDIHGPFFMSMTAHKSGQGCPKCGKESAADKNRREIDFLLSEIRRIHGTKFTYPNISEFKHDKQLMEIICEIHGSFWQSMNGHINHEYGCNKCADIEVGNRSRKSLEEFIAEVRKIHGDKYDYSKVEYEQNKKAVIIGCDIHGDFWQNPLAHTRGSGCPDCAESGFKMNLPGILYIYELGHNGKAVIKYGITNLDPFKNRIKSIIGDGKDKGIEIQSKKIREFHFEIGYLAFEAESIIKTLFKDFKSPLIEGLEGHTEMLSLEVKEDVIKTIQAIKREAEASLGDKN